MNYIWYTELGKRLDGEEEKGIMCCCEVDGSKEGGIVWQTEKKLKEEVVQGEKGRA